eukprot:357811-Chlamydomonas_euryale.AAC.6
MHTSLVPHICTRARQNLICGRPTKGLIGHWPTTFPTTRPMARWALRWSKRPWANNQESVGMSGRKVRNGAIPNGSLSSNYVVFSSPLSP